MTWTLATLPPEILDSILRLNNKSYLAVALFQCGDKLLQTKLASGLTELNLKPTRIAEPQLPVMLSCFSSLRTLTIHSHDLLLHDEEEWLSQLCELPKSLEKLEINIRLENSMACLDELLSDHSAYNAGPMLPKLHSLAIMGSSNHLRRPMLWLENPNAFFPVQSLTSLKLPQCVSDGTLFASLPRSLVNLDSTIVWLNAENLLLDWPSAPPHLAYIRKIYWMATEPLPQLPNCTVSIGSLKLPSVHWTPPIAATIPINTQKLFLIGFQQSSFAENGTNWAAALPRCLTSLSIRQTDLEALLAHTPDLPHTLTRIKNKQRYEENTKVLTSLVAFVKQNGDKAWPPNLRSFMVNDAPLDLILHLPRSITDLRVGFLKESDMRLQIDKLPPHLSLLHFYSRDVLFSGKQWPSSLKTLALPFQLPPTLIASLLPEGLTQLHLGEFKLELFGSLPRALTHLTIVHPAVPTREYFNEGFDAFAALPASLTYLEVQMYRMTETVEGVFSSDSFANLPNLTDLNIYHYCKFKSGCLRNLPRRLKHLRISLEEIEIGDVPFIPPNLLVFQHACSVDFSSPLVLKMWPKNCRHF